MRILYLDVYVRYLNPTNGLIPAMLGLDHEVVAYGPGLCSDAELAAGIDAFLARHGRFDAVVSSQTSWKLGPADIAFFHRSTYPFHPAESLRRFADEADAFLRQTDLRRIIFLTRRDVYSISAAVIENMLSLDAYYVSWAREFTKPNDQAQGFSKEKFYGRKVGKFAFGLWYEVTSAHPERFINFGHFIGENEFDWRPLSGRSRCALVPGVAYHRRADVERRLKAAGLGSTSRWFNRAIAVADRIGLRPYARPLIHQIYNMRFTNEIADTRFAYTDGSGLDSAIRKFFEIPALGTVLLCAPCAGFADLGFVDRENAVAVKPEEVVDAIAWLEREPDVAQKIANAGRALIWRSHSMHARAEQFTRALEAIQRGSFAGSYWRDGQFEINEARSVTATA